MESQGHRRVRHWFTALIKDDLASAIQVAQAVAALREEGPRSAGRWWTASRAAGSITSRSCGLARRPGPRFGCCSRSIPPALPYCSSLLLGGDKAGNWQRWHTENIPIAERLYLDYTTEAEE